MTPEIADQHPKTAEELIRDYAKLVYSIAHQYRNAGVPIEDLRQEGMLGLIKAWESYDPALGNELSTYATFWIKKYILSALDQESRKEQTFVEETSELIANIGVEDPQLGNDLEKYLSSFPENEKRIIIASLGEEKTLKEIALELGIRVEKARLLKQKALRRLRSILTQNQSDLPAEWKGSHSSR